MIFQIKDMFNKSYFYTEYVECIPFDYLESMESAGFRFFIDNICVSKEDIRNRFKDFIEHNDNDNDNDENKINNNEQSSEKVEEEKPTEVDFPITSRTIICINTGKYYKNQKEAADEYHCDSANISYCVTTGKSYKGLFFKKVIEKWSISNRMMISMM